jgi:hypothetical protein
MPVSVHELRARVPCIRQTANKKPSEGIPQLRLGFGGRTENVCKKRLDTLKVSNRSGSSYSSPFYAP